VRGVAPIDSFSVSGPATQTIRLRWHPELRFYEQRISILRKLKEDGLVQAFRVSEEAIDAQLPDWRWLSVSVSGITLNVLTDDVDVDASWDVICVVIEQIAPLRYTHARASYQHLEPLAVGFADAVTRSYERLYRGSLGTDEVTVGDWALLADVHASGPPASLGKIELGIVLKGEVPLRLKQMGGRAPGMQHLGQREWEPSEFKPVSLFADSDLTCPAGDGREEAFLDDAGAFWTASRSQMSRLVRQLGTRLADERDGGE
jgi:hypothetical protein